MCKLSKAWYYYQNCILMSKSEKSIKTEIARWRRIEKFFEDCPLKKITTMRILEFKNHLFSSELSPFLPTRHNELEFVVLLG